MFLKPRDHMRSVVWHIIHNLIAHPLLCLPRSIKWPDRFHDWTANKAYVFQQQNMPIPLITTSVNAVVDKTAKDIDLWEIPNDSKDTTVSC